MKHRRILLGLLVLILLAGLLSVQVFAHVQADADPMVALPAEILAEPAAAQSGYVPGSYTGAKLTWEPYTADLTRSPTTYTDLDDAIDYLQDRAIYRRDDVVVDFKIPYSSRVTDAYLEDLWYDILDAALAHDPEHPDGGDYLLAHIGALEGQLSGNVSGSYVVLRYTYSFDYLSTWAQETTVTNTINKQISKWRWGQKSEYEKICLIYDFMTENIQYDFDGLADETDKKKFTAYGALVEKSAVCQGYASLFYRMCLEAGIDARLIAGVATDGTNLIAHGWNIVKIGQMYYNADPTWDAELAQAGYNYAFFLRSEANFPGHIRDEAYQTASFKKAYPMSEFDYVPGLLQQGTCGDDLYYALADDGTLTISGTGRMYDYHDYKNSSGGGFSPWYDLRSNIKEVVIEEGVTSTGRYAFFQCTEMTKATLPDSINQIGNFTFYSCTSLSEVRLPAQLNTLGYSMFKGCKSLETIALPPTIQIIDTDCFVGSGLKSITISPSVRRIGSQAFSGCKNLTEIVIPNTVEDIGQEAFSYCTALKTVTLDCGYFQYGPPLISDSVFKGCTALETVILQGSMQTIPVRMFEDCENLKTVILPRDISAINSRAFKNCRNLSELRFTGNVPTFQGGVFEGAVVTAYYPMSNITWTEAELPDYYNTVTWIPYEDAGVSCEHANTELRKQRDAICYYDGYTGDTYCSDCGTCIALGQVIPQLGHDMERVNEPGTCISKGYTCDICKRCDIKNIIAYTTFGDHVYENGVCTVCGGVDENYSEKFALYGSSMTLGNALDMNFFVYQSDIGESTGNYAVITKHYADGRADAVADVPQENWKSLGSSLYYFTFSGVRAKEMADKIDVVIYNAEGEAVSEVFTDSVQGYARRMLDNPETIATHRTLYIEMLNYGAAAQAEFGYDTGNLANSVITEEEQAAYGIQDRTYVNQQQKDDAYYGTTLTLENQIVFNIFYHGSYVPEGAYAVAGFTNHYGGQIEERVDAFTTLGNWKYVSFKSLVVSDCSEPITVKLYDADGNLISTVIDSIEGYAARMTEVGPLYDAIMKFADAAYQYFHS